MLDGASTLLGCSRIGAGAVSGMMLVMFSCLGLCMVIPSPCFFLWVGSSWAAQAGFVCVHK